MKIHLSLASLLVGFIATLIFPSTASADTIYACKLKSLGTIRIVSATTNCSSLEIKISWNATGPQGIPGPQGVQGPQGIPGPQGIQGPSGGGLPTNCAAPGDDFSAALGRAVWNGSAWVCKSDLSHYVDNGDGTVTDNQTGLMWEQMISGSDSRCNLFGSLDVRCENIGWGWTGSNPATEPDGVLYSYFLQGLNGMDFFHGGQADCFAGHCDWRIPTLAELRSLLLPPGPISLPCPCIDLIFGPNPLGNFWSSNSVVGNNTDAWGVNFGNGLVFHEAKTFGNFARAVRSVR